MKRVVAFFLCACMIMSCSSTAFAYSSQKEGTNSEIFTIETPVGDCVVQVSEDEVITVMKSEDGTEVNYTDLDNTGDIYKFMLDDEDTENLESAEPQEVIRTVENVKDDYLDVTQKIEGSIEYTEDPMAVPLPRSSITADLFADLEDLEGPEYDDLLIGSSTKGGTTLEVYEEMKFQVRETNTLKWDYEADITLGTFIAAFMRLSRPESIAVACLSIVFNVANDEASRISGKGELQRYRCTAWRTRYTVLEGTSRRITENHYFRDYVGYDDMDMNSTGRAAVNGAELTITYNPDSEFYTNLATLIEDAWSYID